MNIKQNCYILCHYLNKITEPDVVHSIYVYVCLLYSCLCLFLGFCKVLRALSVVRFVFIYTEWW